MNLEKKHKIKDLLLSDNINNIELIFQISNGCQFTQNFLLSNYHVLVHIVQPDWYKSIILSKKQKDILNSKTKIFIRKNISILNVLGVEGFSYKKLRQIFLDYGFKLIKTFLLWEVDEWTKVKILIKEHKNKCKKY